MGCGCANSRAIQTAEMQQPANSPGRFIYLAKKRDQLAKLLQKFSLPADIEEACLTTLSKDCQGFTISATGGEVSALKECIDKILTTSIPTLTLIESGIDFIKRVSTDVSEIDKAFGRYEQSSSEYLFYKLGQLKHEELSKLIKSKVDYKMTFLFCVLGAFRYSAGLNFRGSAKSDANAKAFVIKIYKHLNYLLPDCVNSKPQSIKRRYRRDYAMIASVDDTLFFQEETYPSYPRSCFDSVLGDFCSKVRPNNLFSGSVISQTLAALSVSPEPDRGTESLTSLESRAGTAASTISSPIIILKGTQPNTFTQILVDLLFESQKEAYEIVGEHYCCKENHITRLSQFALYNFLDAVGRKNTTVTEYLSCIEYDLFEQIYPKDIIRPPIAKVMKEFFEVLKDIPMTHNLVYIIQNAEYIDEGFFRVMRRFKTKFPKYLKLVLTMNNQEKSARAASMLSGSLNISVVNGDFILQLCQYICQEFVNKSDAGFQKALFAFTENKAEKVKEVVKAIVNKKQKEKRKLEKEEVLQIMMDTSTYGYLSKINGIMATCKDIESHEDRLIVEKIILFLIETRSPIPIYLLESWLNVTTSPIDILEHFARIFMFSTNKVAPDTIIRLPHKGLWKEVYATKSKKSLKSIIGSITEQCWSTLSTESIMEMPEYYWLNAVHHYLKTADKNDVNYFISAKWLFSQIDGLKSFDCVFQDLSKTICFSFDHGVNALKNHMHILEGIYAGKKLLAPEFISQLQSRLLKETDTVLQQINGEISSMHLPYFKAAHPVLKENSNLEHILDGDSPVTTAFMTSEYLVYATEEGLLCIHQIKTCELIYQYLVDSGILSLCYTTGEKFLLGGKGQYIYLWNINGSPENNPERKIEGHMDGTHKIVYVDGIFFTTGGDNTICKGTLEPFSLQEKTQSMKQKITALQAAKVKDGDCDKILVLAGLINGTVKLFDSKLKLLTSIVQTETSIVSLQFLKKKDSFVSVSSDGEINVYNNTTFVSATSFTIFHINQEELQQVFLFESTSLVVSVERKSIRIYKPGSCSLLDEWLYIFKADIKLAIKSEDEQFLLVADTEGKICIFDLQKPVEQRFSLGIPSHRLEYGINFILSTPGNAEHRPHLITCSNEREIKVWSRDTCKFIKKFNLSSVATDVITAAAMDRSHQNIIYLGCKDTNIYKVDLSQGIATEPLAEQYTRVTHLKTSSINRGIVICVAEKNVLIWSARSKHPITEFSGHKASVIFIQDQEDPQSASIDWLSSQIIQSIDASFVYIKWNWETKEILHTSELFPQTASYLEEEIGLLATIISKLAFIATTAGYVRVFSLNDDSLPGIILIDDLEMPVAIESIEVASETYLLVVKKTKAVLYKVIIENYVKVDLLTISGMSLNSTVTKEGIVKGKLYSLFFTAAYMISTLEEDQTTDNDVTLSAVVSNPLALEGTAKEEKVDKSVEEVDKTAKEEAKSSLLGNNVTFAKESTLEHSLGPLKKKHSKKPVIMIYLADSRAFLHVYKVGDLVCPDH